MPAPAADCKITCADKPGEYCGGSSRLNVYRAGVVSSSSTTQSTTQTTTQSTSQTSSSSSIQSTSLTNVQLTTTSRKTSSASDISSSTVTSISVGSSSAATSSTTQIPVSSSTTVSPIFTSSSSSATSQSVTSSSRPTSTITGPVAAPTVGVYTYQGCFLESASQGLSRALALASFPSDEQTALLCATNCAAYSYFGLQYSRECWCGNELNPAAVSVPETDCSMPCAADKGQLCGGGNRLNVYRKPSAPASSSTVGVTSTSVTSQTTTTSASPSSSDVVSTTSLEISSTTISSPTLSTSVGISTFTTIRTSSSIVTTSTTTTSSQPVYTGPPVVVPGNTNFTYYSCVSEPSSGKLFSSQVENSVGMTIDRCLSVCWNYQYAGVEYGRECWCGNTINFNGSSTAATPGRNTSDADCKIPCIGNSSQFCGGSSRISLYWFDKEKASKPVDLSRFLA